MMRKSIHTRDYSAFIDLLIKTRHDAGLTQAELGNKLPFGQPAISKIERGERRLDVIELRMICQALNTDLSTFVRRLEKQLKAGDRG